MNREELIAFCLTFPGAYVDYPFDEEWTTLRHGDNKRCFAFIFERWDTLCINLKCEPMEADLLRGSFSAVIPGYHMNKRHWNTVLLNGTVPQPEVERMIALSFELTGKKR